MNEEEVKDKVKIENPLNMKRQEGETFKDYKDRCKYINRLLRYRLRGSLVWDSYEKGTYVKDER